MPILSTKGAMSAQGFGEFAQTTAPVYIEDVFSTYLYTGNNSTQTITNGIDLASEGGLVWTKVRSTTDDHELIDTVRGRAFSVESNTIDAQSTSSVGTSLTQFNSNGYSLGTNGSANVNENAQTFVSWTFRKAEKFFDVVTYTGNGVAGRTIAHNLGSEPGCIILKNTSTSGIDWIVYHRSLGNGQAIFLNLTNAAQSYGAWNYTSPTATNFTVSGSGEVNGTSQNYVAYLFAHNAGGFGLTNSDNVITCGSFVASGSGAYNGSATINLGWEPQFVLMKQANNTLGRTDWTIVDNIRGWPVPDAVNAFGNARVLAPNTSAAEVGVGDCGWPTATGFQVGQVTGGATYIYIAIRRGPMKTPTSGTSVFAPIANSNSTGTTNTTNFPVDMQMWALRGGYGENFTVHDRLRGVSTTSTQTLCPDVITSSTAAEKRTAFVVRNWNNTGFETPSGLSGASTVYENFRRAPGFFDVVCYTADSVNGRTINHNLTVAPEFTIFKSRSATSQWYIWHNSFALNQEIYLTTSPVQSGGIFTSAPTSSAIFASSGNINFSSFGNVVAYLFATVSGVSKVGSYAGTGTSQTINCGFTNGTRFALIKRTDSTGDWYVFDSARGITPSSDPYLFLNSTNAEVTGQNFIDSTSVGFDIASNAPAALNSAPTFSTQQINAGLVVQNGRSLNGKLFLVGANDSSQTIARVRSVTDDANYNIYTGSSGTYIRDIAYGNGVYVVVGAQNSNTSTIYYSSNLSSWTSASHPSLVYGYQRVVFGNGIFVAAGNDNGGSGTYIAYSTNGINWTAVTSVTNRVTFLSFTNGIFVGWGSNSSTIYTSSDGINWNSFGTDVGGYTTRSDIVYAMGVYASLRGDGYFIYSGNAINWTVGQNLSLQQGSVGYNSVTNRFLVNGGNNDNQTEYSWQSQVGSPSGFSQLMNRGLNYTWYSPFIHDGGMISPNGSGYTNSRPSYIFLAIA